MLANSVGLIDNGYRGELLVCFKFIRPIHESEINSGQQLDFTSIKKYKKGEKIAQLVAKETIEINFDIVEETNISDRNVGGFGSSGN